MPSPFSVAGPRLRDNSIACLPIMAGGKAPGTLMAGVWRPEHKWSRFCDRLPSKYEMEIWERWADAGVGAALGASSGGLVAIDVDTDDTATVAAIMAVLPPSPVRKRGRKGVTLFYRASPAVLNRSYNDSNRIRLLDLLAHGRQTVLPPSIHPDTGQPYVWVTQDTLEDFAVADLPLLPDDIGDKIGEALKPWGYQPEELRSSDPGTAALTGESVHRALNDAALANLDAWVPALQLHGCRRVYGNYKAVAHWRPSSSGRPLAKRATNLAISHDGIKDCGDQKGYTALDLVMAACGVDLEMAYRWLQERVAPQTPVVLNLTKARDPAPLPAPAAPDEMVPTLRARPGNLAGLVGAAVVPHDPETGEIIELPAMPEPQGLGVIPPELCTPPGLLGEIVEWMTASAAKPVPQHNLGAALGLLGAAMGRRWESPTRARTNFYIMGLAPSGFGKDHPMGAARQLAASWGLQKYMAAEETKSDSAIRKMLERYPVAFLMMDEFGGFMKKVLDRRAASHDKRMRDLMLTFFSRANQDYMGSEGATERAVVIHQPHLCIYGASTPDDLWDAFDSSSGKDGLLARFLVFSAGDKRPRRVRPTEDVTTPPRALLERLRAFMDVKPPGNLNGVGDQQAKPIRAEWGPQAEEWFNACDERNMDLSDRGGARGTVYARVAEHTLKLALVYAVGCEPQRPVITTAGLEWASEIVACSMATLFAAMDDRVADNDRQSEYLWVLRTIREGGRFGIAVSGLKKMVNGRFDRRRFDDIMGQLVDSKEIENYMGSGASGGRPAARVRGYISEAEAA